MSKFAAHLTSSVLVLKPFPRGMSSARLVVAWVTVGKEHLPRTEDVPLISNFGTYFVVSPHNQWHGNAAMDLMKSEM